MLCVQAGQEGVLGVLTLILGSGLVFKQRKRIKDPTENTSQHLELVAEFGWMLNLLLLSDFLVEVELGGNSCT